MLISTLLIGFCFLAMLGIMQTYTVKAVSESQAIPPVPLGVAGNFTILAESEITTTTGTAITGDLGISPLAASYITGFGLVLDSSGVFATSSLVTGRIYAANYAQPAPTVLTTAIGNMTAAYTNAAGRTNPNQTELGSGNIGGMTIGPGLYKWSTGVTIPTSVTLSGSSTDVWIFQIAGNLLVSSGAQVILGGAQAQNIFWQVAGQVTLGTTSAFSGTILCATAINLQAGATLNGRALAQTGVTLISNTIIGFSHDNPVPEFSSILILPLAMLATLFAAMLVRKKVKR